MEIGLQPWGIRLDYGVTNMKKITVLTGLILATWAGATVCNQDYHLQEAYQYILTGNTSAAMTAGAALKLNKDMGGATLLHDTTEYRLITDWDGKGTCDAWAKREVTFNYRAKAGKTMGTQKSMDYFLKLNSGAFQFKTPGWDEYWFGLASKVAGDTVQLWDAVGKFKSESKLKIWYGNATMKRTVRDSLGSAKESFTHFYPEITSHPDSAALVKILLDTWKQYVTGPRLTVDFKVQLIKITYDSLPTPSTRVAASRHAKANGFQASQTGGAVLIKAGANAVAGEPLSLYGMMGNKVTTLHPTGYYYQWNGKTAQGAEAPPGVYFVQAGNRILGKFFFSR